MMTIDTRQLAALERDLGRLYAKALPHATKATVNGAAFKARGFAQEQIREKLINRNAFSVNSVRVERAKTLDIDRQSAAVGSVADHMAELEFGTTKRATGRHGVPIATSYGAGQGMKTRPRTRLTRRPNKMASIRLQHKARVKGDREQRNIVAIKQAASSTSRYAFLDLGKTRGIFRVVGGKRRPKLRMVWDMSRRTVDVAPRRWLAPAVAQTEPLLQGMYADALRFQIRRQRLFRER